MTITGDCQHPQITTWNHEGEPAGLWSCAQCGLKFVPLDLEAEKDARRYSLFIASAPQEEVCFLGVSYFGKAALDAAIDGVMAEV
jgi:hypothetical protein